MSKLFRSLHHQPHISYLVRLQSTATAGNVDSTARPFEDIPGPRGLPLLGNLLEMINKDSMKHAVKVHSRLQEEFGDIYKFKLPGGDLVCIKNPEDSRTLLDNDGPIPFLPGFEKIEYIRSTSLKHLFNSEPGLLSQGEVWQRSRKAVQQDLMRPKSALYYVDELNATGDELCAKLQATLDENRETTNLNYHLQEFALEASGIMFIGTKLGVLRGSEDGVKLMEAVSAFINRLQHLFTLPVWALKISGIYSNVVKNMTILFEVCASKSIAAIEKDKKDGSLEGTVLGKLLDRCEPGSQLPIVMAVDAMSAGIDTTAHTATILLYHLATNPDKQEKLFQEISAITGKHGDMTEQNLIEMKYLKACLQESQRLMPIAFATARKTQSDLVLSGYNVPRGTLVLRTGLACYDNSVYPEALSFVPERFIRDDPQYANVDRFTNLPFGHGPRSCVGQRFARLENYMVAFKVLQQFRLEFHHEPIEIDYTGIGKPDRLVRIKMVKRE